MTARQLPLRALLRVQQPRPSLAMASSPTAFQLGRPFSTTLRLSGAGKGEEHRSTLDPRSSEYTKSGSDSDVAAHTSASFNPKETQPEDSKASFQKESNGSPLEFSGANRDISGSPTEKKTSDKQDHPDRQTRSVGSGGRKKHGNLAPKTKT